MTIWRRMMNGISVVFLLRDLLRDRQESTASTNRVANAARLVPEPLPRVSGDTLHLLFGP